MQQGRTNTDQTPPETTMVRKAFIDLQEFEKIKAVAEYFVTAKALPKWIDNAGKLVMIMQAGRDLGLSVTQSMSGLAIINGIVTVYGGVAATLMKRAGYRWTVGPMVNCPDGDKKDVMRQLKIWHIDSPETVANIEYRRSEATRAWLVTKDVWKTYPDTMMYRKLLAKARKEFCPEVCDGTPMYEDYIDMTAWDIPNDWKDTDSLASKIESCTTVEELEEYSKEVSKAKSKDMIALYSAKKRVLSSKSQDAITIDSEEDSTNIGEQATDVWDLPTEDTL